MAQLNDTEDVLSALRAAHCQIMVEDARLGKIARMHSLIDNGVRHLENKGFDRELRNELVQTAFIRKGRT